MKKLSQFRKRKGFTLIEMVIVMFIISMLLLIMIPNLVGQKQSAEKKSDAAFAKTVETQINLDTENNSVIAGKVVDNYKKDLTKSQFDRAGKLGLTVDSNGNVTKP